MEWPKTFNELTGIKKSHYNNEHKTCYIMGDFNIDLLKFSSNNKISIFVNLINSNDFFPCIDRPTRITAHSATLLDYIITNDTSTKIRSGVFVTDITDHFPIFTTTCNPSSTNFNHQFCIKRSQVRQLKPDNIKGFKNDLPLILMIF